MPIGVNLLCLSGFIEAEHLDQIRAIKDLGYDGVEIPVLRGNPQHYAWLGRELDAIGHLQADRCRPLQLYRRA